MIVGVNLAEILLPSSPVREGFHWWRNRSCYAMWQHNTRN